MTETRPAAPAGGPAGLAPSAEDWDDLLRLASPTEERNPRTTDIDLLPTADVVRRITDEDAGVADAVRAQADHITAAVDLAVTALRGGGKVHYFGSGTSGRLGVLDAVELLPTYGVGDEWFEAHLAGGAGAMMLAVEGAEDDVDLGRRDADGVRPGDLVVGLAASGRTPYVGGAFDVAAERGASTVLISANPQARLAPRVDVAILVNTGPEVVTGSTRMKAATAQKLVLNTFSTATMIRLGKTYSNLMIDVRPTNQKLRARIVRILVQATGLGTDECEQVLARAGGEIHVALVMLLAGVGADEAHEALRGAGAPGVRRALELLGA
jgi:N-acetylmuramic acid 6-phosphate etherase